jgi:hypothetical protein
MGASNAMAAYAAYAGKVPPLSLSLLVYMALVSKDSDPNPWYGQGHEVLARFAMGRGRHAKVSASDLRAVDRGLKPLREVGAIVTDRPAAVRRDGPNTARYRLDLNPRDARRKPSGVKGGGDPSGQGSRTTETVGRPPVDNSVEDPPRATVSGSSRTTISGTDARRFVVSTPDENRRTEEPRGDTRSDNFKEEENDLRADLAASRARGSDEDTIPLPLMSPEASPRAEPCPHGHDPRFCHPCRSAARAARGAA